MKPKFLIGLLLAGALARSWAADITTLDGHKYTNVRDVVLKPNGLFFVVGSEDSLSSMRSYTVAYTNLPDAVREKYHCDAFDLGLAQARRDVPVNLNRGLAFSLDQLPAAEAKAKAEHKLLGFIMEWDSLFKPAYPLGMGSDSGLADFYDVFHDALVLVFVRHENELNKVPESVKRGFFGPEEGGFAPNMAVVTADCSRFVCEIPFGGKESTGQIREQIFRQKIAVIKKFLRAPEAAK